MWENCLKFGKISPDYILDDLQQSISRPGSSLGQPINNNYSSQREVHYLNPVNQTTVLRERSLSPNISVSQVYPLTFMNSIYYNFIDLPFHFSRTKCTKHQNTNTQHHLEVAASNTIEETIMKSTNSTVCWMILNTNAQQRLIEVWWPKWLTFGVPNLFFSSTAT